MINMYLLEGDKDVSVTIKDSERTKSLIKLTFPYYSPTEILNLCRIYNVGVVYTLDRTHEISRRIKSAGYRVVSINDIFNRVHNSSTKYKLVILYKSKWIL